MTDKVGAAWSERNVEGKTFVFFGGSSGIGRAAAVSLAKRGANILIVGRGAEAGQQTVSELLREGASQAAFLAGDLSSYAGVCAVVEGVLAWSSTLYGVVHSAMAAFEGKQVTTDGLEFAFALQYFARTQLNIKLKDALAASGDGRIIHIAGDIPGFIKPNLDDLQFEQESWSFFKSVLGTHALGFLHIEEASRRWANLPITLVASCVGSTKTKAMQDPRMPWVMRVMAIFGTKPENSAANTIHYLTADSVAGLSGSVFRKPKKYVATPLALDRERAEKLWRITEKLANSLS